MKLIWNWVYFFPSAEQALYNLQQLRHDTDQAKKDKNVLLADLREKAASQGLTLIDNDGPGNCMFSALCHQLKIKKRLKQYSEMELRTELAQYLKAHPELVCRFLIGTA